ncbi:MAG: ribonuclease III [Myxococcota bacterium]
MSAEAAREKALGALEDRLGIRFSNRSLLEAAFRHSSYAHDHGEIESNERLEFLGDSVLALVVANALYRAKPDWQEGELTRSLHALVEGRSLARVALAFELGPLIQFGRTEEASGGAEKPSILADTVEALIGALYIDGGIERATELIERAFGDRLTAEAPKVDRDPKTDLQEQTMAEVGEFPKYETVGDTGIEGDDVRFKVEVRLQGETIGSGIGRTKRKAERAAAEFALEIRTAPEGDGESLANESKPE